MEHIIVLSQKLGAVFELFGGLGDSVSKPFI